jgi:uridine kinase
MQEMRPFVIGVAGGSGSGKTTVSTRIREVVGTEHIAYLQHDNYYRDQGHLTFEERVESNYDHPDSLETSLMVEQLRVLRAGNEIQMPLYNFATHRRMTETKRVAPSHIVLVEGILIFTEADLRELMDMRIFVDTDPDIRFIRRVRRDMNERGRSLDSVISQYVATVRPMHLEFVEPSKRYADIIVPAGGHNRVAMEMIVSRIHAILAECE